MFQNVQPDFLSELLNGEMIHKWSDKSSHVDLDPIIPLRKLFINHVHPYGYGGFHSHGGIQNGWFISKIPLKFG